ncbi:MULTISPECIES: type II toxin-antitoxin system VapC family toxin [Calothrix]|uniref:Type II toxin-antitoxin system VapC family toxin n=2 Tax=Calothrix TaxID=1186 RepID=A0ABR8A6N1_9CYAN|nr:MULTISPECIES: type II toxin-antitoxin system VapC family toxin [Calothrix]MBD2194726.1 type II toxin-antitoxin system VapC family toxin [Calothrix parietina FACHB-288]MBD2225124.1 type II toxin-antitoxin system VapC family toxin [Calothrix anomala FACHB-343]
MYLLDTNICIALLNENPLAITKFNRFFSQCYLSIIVVSELYKGIYCSQHVAKNLEILAQFTELLPVEPFHIELVLTVNCQPSTVNRQLSTVNCQLSTVNSPHDGLCNLQQFSGK